MSMLKATSHLAFFFELRQNCAEMSSKLNEEEGKGIKVGTCVTFSHLSNFVLLLLAWWKSSQRDSRLLFSEGHGWCNIFHSVWKSLKMFHFPKKIQFLAKLFFWICTFVFMRHYDYKNDNSGQNGIFINALAELWISKLFSNVFYLPFR